MKGGKKSTLIRRSIAIRKAELDELLAVVPADERHNVNRLILRAIREFVRERRRRAFAEEMARMAADPDIQRECRAIAEEFKHTEMDGLD